MVSQLGMDLGKCLQFIAENIAYGELDLGSFYSFNAKRSVLTILIFVNENTLIFACTM